MIKNMSFVVIIFVMLITIVYSGDLQANNPEYIEVCNILENREMGLTTLLDTYGTSHNVLLAINKYSNTYDYDQDGLLDYYEVFRNFTDPENPDSDGDGILDGDWEERKEYNYTLTAQIRSLKPYDIEFMTTHPYQDIKVIEDTGEYVDFEIIVYPYNNMSMTFLPNPYWKTDNLPIMEEIKPGRFNDWNEQFKEDLLVVLDEYGINPDELTDIELINKIRYYFGNDTIEKENYIKYLTADIFVDTGGHMFDWFVNYNQEGDPFFTNDEAEIESALEELNRNTDRKWTYHDFLKVSASSTQQFYYRAHGSCSSNNTFYANILQALGIPAKVVPISTLADSTAWNYSHRHEAHNNEMYQSNYKRGEDINNEYIKNDWFKHCEIGGGTHTTSMVYIGNKWVMTDFVTGVLNYPMIIDEQFRIFRFGNYDFGEFNIEEVSRWSISQDKKQNLNNSNNFEPKYQSRYNNYDCLGWKTFNLNEQYGEHMTEEVLEYIDNHHPNENWRDLNTHNDLLDIFYEFNFEVEKIGETQYDGNFILENIGNNSNSLTNKKVIHGIDLTGKKIFWYDAGNPKFINLMDSEIKASRGFIYHYLKDEYNNHKQQADIMFLSSKIPYLKLPLEVRNELNQQEYKNLPNIYNVLQFDNIDIFLVNVDLIE